MRKLCVYLHGFNSSPHALKPSIIRKALQGSGIDFFAPDLLGEPEFVMANLREELLQRDADQLLLIGSSLGGYYAAHLHDSLEARIVLVNPAMNPTASRDLLGVHTNPYSNTRFEVTENMFKQLENLSPSLSKQGEILLMLQTGDAIIDYRYAKSLLPNARQLIQVGGSHGFDHFEFMVNDVLDFGFG